ncbi:unnamed protein product [Effrenium voratum]|uniref:Cyclic nucleotide-binding domain-containing protein n=1 Tax=Effrenium voratum TaxID=2562239 RepID=A0AA36N679_9DINO|nr:unnamed protein product [Effrenium voratum]
MDWMTLLFWSLNVVATLTVGFTKRDTSAQSGGGGFEDLTMGDLFPYQEEGVRLLRILRLARTARLLRLLKLQKVMEKLSDYLDSEAERTFAIFVVVFALVGFSYVVGSILGSLAQLRSMTEQSAKDFWMMRRFLRRNHVPMELASRIQRFVEHAHSQQQKKMSIKVLGLLSGGLMEELQCAMNMPHMMVHPLFAFLSEFSVITVQRLAKEAVHRAQLARGDTQFLPNQEGSFMYFIAGGKMQYIRDGDSPDPRVEVVDKGEDWIAEPVMWTSLWVHVGQLTAVSECDLCAVAPKAFGDIVALIRRRRVLGRANQSRPIRDPPSKAKT